MTQFFGNMAALEAGSEAAGEIMKKQMAMIGFHMMAAYEKLLKQGLEFKVSDLRVKLAEGEIKGGLTLRLLKAMCFMQFASIVSQPELLFDIFYLKSDFSLLVNLVGEDPKLLSPLYPGMQTGLFVKNFCPSGRGFAAFIHASQPARLPGDRKTGKPARSVCLSAPLLASSAGATVQYGRPATVGR